MLAGAARPWIFLDIYGVLIPFRARSGNGERSSAGAANEAHDGNPLLEQLDPHDGRRLLALPGELVWATTWMTEANEVVAPRLGLPVLPVVTWPDSDEQSWPGVHWKRCSSRSGPLDARSSGSMTRRPMSTGTGSPITTQRRRCCIVSILTWD